MRVALPLMTAAGLLAATACSSQAYDQDAHRQALEDHGVSVPEDMNGVTAAVEAACESDDPSLVVFDFLNEGGSPDALRIGIEHMCPERVEEFEDALT
ncbi:hypothetical protein DFP74_2431 [Nocardiopsis sp. Huas11]|uniref:hypothetical protein n=1 Tax=Nocardiopsis sp. Huas11 TaxID=2183912 RepID=UPI000EAD89E6|nr:hypothetical protein [Nocardiopsis sp. Huas11]RKS06786.1 hypothetical protein DFP74_2431 [Nocardiopsis sp. Huas11]